MGSLIGKPDIAVDKEFEVVDGLRRACLLPELFSEATPENLWLNKGDTSRGRRGGGGTARIVRCGQVGRTGIRRFASLGS